MTPRQVVSENILGSVEWQDQNLGFCRCPGDDLHTHQTGKNHCRVTLDKVPTIYCFHTSCSGAVESANHRLRSEVGKVERGEKVPHGVPRVITDEERAALSAKRKAEELKSHASKSLSVILKQNHTEPGDLWALSPVPLHEDPRNDWRLLLALFHPDDVLWIGDKNASCPEKRPEDMEERRWLSWRQHCLACFRPVSAWLPERQAPGQFTCPCTFKPGVFSRSNANIVQRRFLVIESDSLTKTQMCSIIMWCRRFMRLRAVVDTAGKSLHGWFDAPPSAVEKELRLVLPSLQTDPALFKLSQPCRLPGAMRDGRYQSLYYLAP